MPTGIGSPAWPRAARLAALGPKRPGSLASAEESGTMSFWVLNARCLVLGVDAQCLVLGAGCGCSVLGARCWVRMLSAWCSVLMLSAWCSWHQHLALSTSTGTQCQHLALSTS